MSELLNEYWQQIMIVLGNLLIIFKMLNTLKVRVKDTANDSLKLFNKVSEDVNNADLDVRKLSEGVDVILDYIEMEGDLKQISKVIPDEYKEKYEAIKNKSLRIHEEIRKLKG